MLLHKQLNNESAAVAEHSKRCFISVIQELPLISTDDAIYGIWCKQSHGEGRMKNETQMVCGRRSNKLGKRTL